MPLNPQQKGLIVTIDKRVKTILANGGNEETLLVEMLDLMPKFKAILDKVPTKELEMQFHKYDGFYHYVKVLENLARGIADGRVTVSE